MLETLDLFKIVFSGILQMLYLFAKAIYDAGFPTNVLIVILLFGAPATSYLKFR